MAENDKTPEWSSVSDYPLPKVSKEIGDSIFADAQEQGIDAVMSQANEQLSVNNPNLYTGVGQYAVGLLGSEASPEAIKVVHGVMVMTHELLRRQAEADALQGMMAPPETEG